MASEERVCLPYKLMHPEELDQEIRRRGASLSIVPTLAVVQPPSADLPKSLLEAVDANRTRLIRLLGDRASCQRILELEMQLRLEWQRALLEGESQFALPL
jgi:hypothetical protein